MTLEAPDVVERPTEIPPVDAKPAWLPAIKRAAKKFSLDGGTDSAAMLTYYGLFSLFPALAAVVSLISLVVSPNTIMDILTDLTGKSASDLSTVKTIIDNFADSSGAGLTLVIGVLTALWSASGYVGGFSRTMNRIYGVEEGRPVLKLRPWLYLVTAIQALMIVIIILSVALSGGLAKSIFGEIGLGDEASQVWDIAKLPFIAVMVVIIIGLLYWATPNVKKPRRMFFSWGALFAFVVWILATIAFVLYVGLSAGASYQKTFGPFATAALFMFWLWLTNVVILFGAELDAELERTRQLRSGLPAETMILFPLRDGTEIEKRQQQLDQAIADSYELQEESDRTLDEHGIPVMGREAHPAVARVADSEAPDDAGDDVTNKETATGPVTTAALRTDIDQERAERRQAGLAEMRQQRKTRDRLEEQERAAAKEAEKAEKKRQKEAEAKAKAEAEAVPLADRWAAVDTVRARYAPPRSDERDAVEAERDERRAAFRAEQAEKAANPPPPKPPKPAKVPMPSPLRDDVSQERERRRDDWYADHAREMEEVPLPKRRDLKG